MSEQNVQEEVVSVDALKAELTNKKMNNTSIN